MNLRKAIEQLEAGAQEFDVTWISPEEEDAYANAFLNALSTNTTLKTLKCDKSISVRALASSLYNNVTLTHLDVGACRIDNAGVRALVYALFDNERCRRLGRKFSWLRRLGAESHEWQTETLSERPIGHVTNLRMHICRHECYQNCDELHFFLFLIGILICMCLYSHS
jgi:hypothetical protein